MKIGCLLLLFALSLVCVSSCGDDENAAFSVYNYPNPFTYKSGTTIVLDYQGNNTGTLKYYLYIYDLNGFPIVAQEMLTEVTGPGEIKIPWNAANERGKKLAPGIYTLKVTTVNFANPSGVITAVEAYTATHKMMVQ
jgi:hypothetical protein